MSEEAPIPIENSYWVLQGRLLAGEYPGAHSAREAKERVERFLDLGVSAFIDLTYPGEFGIKPYDSLLLDSAGNGGPRSEYRRFPVGDMRVPTPEAMGRILDAIDQALDEGRMVYLHCYGGLGRTGTVVGCFLVRHGMDGQKALLELRDLRRSTPHSYLDSPQTPEQTEMILRWKDLDRESVIRSRGPRGTANTTDL
jgi:hypothetical protein